MLEIEESDYIPRRTKTSPMPATMYEGETEHIHINMSCISTIIGVKLVVEPQAKMNSFSKSVKPKDSKRKFCTSKRRYACAMTVKVPSIALLKGQDIDDTSRWVCRVGAGRAINFNVKHRFLTYEEHIISQLSRDQRIDMKDRAHISFIQSGQANDIAR
jgi:hypothetical protein